VTLGQEDKTVVEILVNKARKKRNPQEQEENVTVFFLFVFFVLILQFCAVFVYIARYIKPSVLFLQSFDAVGWVAGRASGL